MQFDFVSEDNKPYSKRDKATRHLIRKRATQAAAETRKDARRRAARSMLNPGQYTPSNVLTTKGLGATQQSSVGGEFETPLSLILSTISTCPGMSHAAGSERPVAGGDSLVDLQWPALYMSPAPPVQPHQFPRLLPLPKVQALLIGRLLSRYALKEEHIRISKILSLTSAGFMSMVPSQYGRHSCLDAAIDCVGSRVQEFLSSPRSPQRLSANLYGYALQQLQVALHKSDGRKKYDLLLAIPLLCLYELLSYDNKQFWLLHAQGTAALFKHIGPQNITNELQRTLLITQAPFIIHEALFKAQSCYLGEEKWGAAIASSVDFTASEYDARSNLVVSMLLMTRRLPNLFLRVERAASQCEIENKNALKDAVEALHNEFDDFYSTWAHVLATKRFNNSYDELRIYLLATVHAYSALTARLLFALTPSTGRSAESSALSSATLAHEIANHAATSTPNIYARMAFATIIASSIIESSLEWVTRAKNTPSGAVIDAAVLRAWCRVLGRFQDDIKLSHEANLV